MYQAMIHLIKRTLKSIILAACVLAAAGCATVSSDELVPKSFTLPASRQSYAGAVQVNAMLDPINIRIIRPRELVNLDILATYFTVPKDTLWKAMALNDADIGWYYADLQRNMYMVAFSNLKLNSRPFGRIRSSPDNTAPVGMTQDHARFAGNLMKEALEKSIISNHLFTSVAQAQADYVLDLWIDRIDYKRPPLGIGEYKADVLSIWRLTRVRDGKVLACDFVLGHGINAEPGMGPSQRSYNAAMRDLINNGLAMLFDRSQEHLHALIPAGMNRPGMGSAMPEGSDRWKENIRQNWSKLQKGMTVDEVETAIGSVRINNTAWDYHYILPVRFHPSKSEPMAGLGELDFIEYKTGLYSLIFMSEKEYNQNSAQPRTSISLTPPNTHRLLIWKLNP